MRAARGRLSMRHRLVVLIAVLTTVVSLAACSSSKKSTSTQTTAASTSTSATTGTSSSTAVSAGGDVGITATTIRVGLIADVNTPVFPGLFQKNVDALNAWASIVNAKGGIAGRKVVVDFCDGKLDANATTNCVIKQCANDFALVGTAANVLTDISDLDTCKNAEGKAIGIPNLAFVGFPPLACDKVTYLPFGQADYCATIKDKPQTYTTNVGDYVYYQKTFPDLHGIYVYDGDVPQIKPLQVPGFQLGVNLGIKKDGEGFYAEPGAAPQSALTPLIQVLKRSKSTFGYGGATFPQTILIRREAALQGVKTVKVWACNSGCYSNDFIKAGGSAIEGEYAPTPFLPFYSDYKSNPTLSALVDKLGGIDNLNGNSILSFVQALLFEDVVAKATANGGALTRQSVFDALNNEHSFDADGIVGTTDVAAHKPSPCIVINQVKDGKWQRVFPTEAGKFDCDAANVQTIKMDLSS